jgi:hypothetical protein
LVALWRSSKCPKTTFEMRNTTFISISLSLWQITVAIFFWAASELICGFLRIAYGRVRRFSDVAAAGGGAVRAGDRLGDAGA